VQNARCRILNSTTTQITNALENEKGSFMIAEGTIWTILRGHMPRERWVSSQDIYAIVESHCNLDEEDRQTHTTRSKTPKWKTLVRDVLMNRLKNGKLRWRRGSNRRSDTVH